MQRLVGLRGGSHWQPDGCPGHRHRLIEEPVFEDTLLEKLDSTPLAAQLDKLSSSMTTLLLTSCFIDSVPSPSRLHHFYIPVIELWQKLRVMIDIDGPLVSLALLLIGAFHIRARALLDI